MDDLKWLMEMFAKNPDKRVCEIEVPDIKAEPEFGGEQPTMRLEVANPYYKSNNTIWSSSDTTPVGTTSDSFLTYTEIASQELNETAEQGLLVERSVSLGVGRNGSILERVSNYLAQFFIAADGIPREIIIRKERGRMTEDDPPIYIVPVVQGIRIRYARASIETRGNVVLVFYRYSHHEVQNDDF